MNIVIVGVTGCRNRGVEALVVSAIDGIKSSYPDAAITVVSSDSQYDATRLSSQTNVIPDAPPYFRAGHLERLVRTRGGLKIPPELTGIRAALSNADFVVASGGDIFSSDYGFGFLYRQASLVRFAQRSSCKTVFLAHSIGPFRSKREADLMRQILLGSTHVSVRESLSRGYLINELGIPEERVRLASDVAFLLQPISRDRTNKVLSLLGFEADAEFIALAPSEGITSFSDARDRARHDLAWTDLISYILSNTQLEVLLIPHVQDTNISNDDTQIAFRIAAAFEFNARIKIAAGAYSAADYKGLIGRSVFFVGERMHACIAALSQGIPSMVIGYSVKAHGIVKDIFQDETDRLCPVIPVQDFCKENQSIFLFKELFSKSKQTAEFLKGNIPRIKQNARHGFDFLEIRG